MNKEIYISSHCSSYAESGCVQGMKLRMLFEKHQIFQTKRLFSFWVH